VHTPFQSAEWLVPWWRAFGHGELRAVLVHAGGEPRALGFVLVEADDHASRVTLLGLGNSDYLDVIDVHAETKESVVTALLSRLSEAFGPGDRCEFEHVPSGSTLLTASAPPYCRRSAGDCGVCPVLALPPREDELADVVPRRLLAALRRARAGLERQAPVRIDRATGDNLPELLGQLFALHRARWRMRGIDGVLADDAVRGFLREVAEGFQARGALRMYALRVGDRTAAVLCGFAWGRRMYYYASGFDPTFAKYSVGSLVLEHAIREAIRTGDTELDFLSGAEPYKYRWGATDRAKRRVELVRESATA
jgi:CelD/BcsL family acetyltransferase involved in cellulose biosynthesis